MKKAIIPVLLVILALAWWWWHPSHPLPEAPSAAPRLAVRVKVAAVRRQPTAQQAVAQGSIFPLRQATVSAVQSGVISEMPLWKNHYVHQGETLATLNMRDLQAQRNEAQALVTEAEVNLHNLQNSSTVLAAAGADKDLQLTSSTLRNAQALYQRRQQLFQQGGIALKDLQDSQMALSIAQANYSLSQHSSKLLRSATTPGSIELARVKLAQAKLRVATLSSPLSFATIRAPISGVVIDQFQFLGEFVTPGTKLVTIADLSEVIVKGQFADTVLAELKVGEKAEVRPLDRPGVKLQGRVSALSAVTDAQSRSGEVWVNLHNPDGRLRSGGFCEIAVSTQSVSSVVVAASAVTRENPESPHGWVSVVDGQEIAHKRKVECGLAQDGWIQILSGLRVGERVVTEGNYSLGDGVPVEVQENAP